MYGDDETRRAANRPVSTKPSPLSYVTSIIKMFIGMFVCVDDGVYIFTTHYIPYYKYTNIYHYVYSINILRAGLFRLSAAI